MDYYVPCECGNEVPVSEGAAGASLRCDCGRTISVPSLDELRRQSGRTAPAPPARVLIEYMLADGELPTLKCCFSCSSPTDEVTHVVAECEKTWTTGPSGASRLVAFLVIGIWAVLLERGGSEQGSNVILHLPVRLCRRCRRRLSPSSFAMPMTAFAVVAGVAGLFFMAMGMMWGAGLLAVPLTFWLAYLIAKLRRQGDIKEVLRREPIYRRLTDDYPDAVVVLTPDGS